MSETLNRLFEDISRESADSANRLPPVKQWNPPLSGTIDIVIKRDGTWLHEGEPIKRQAIVWMFSSILKREDGNYFLVTPLEKWQVQVEDMPFSVTALEVLQRERVQALVFETSVGDRVVAGSDHPLRVEVGDNGEPHPYLYIRDDMEGLLTRAVFYELANLAQPGPDGKKAVQGVYSLGEFFSLE